MEDASKARRRSCIRAMVKLNKPSVTKLLDTHIYSTLLWYHLWSWSSSAQSRDRCVAGPFNSTVLSLSIHCYRLSLSLDGLWEIKKDGASGSGSSLFYYQILNQSRICLFVPWLNLIYLLRLDRPLSHILKVQIHIRWNSVSAPPRDEVPFHLTEFLCFLYLNVSYFFRYFLPCWAVYGRCDCFGTQGHASKTAVIVRWWMYACGGGWEWGELQPGAGRPLTAAIVAQVACVKALLETNQQ
jgi:hypothetical protein